ncbi:MAG: 6-phosphogluconolactonase [Candidatus Saccharimonas sp.]
MTDITVRPADEIVSYLESVIAGHLRKNQSVLWLVPGGSASIIALDVLRLLEKHDTSQLSITLTDERYGLPGHPNENWTQLMRAGFRPVEARTYRVLSGADVDETTLEYAKWLDAHVESVDYTIGLFGIGADGHTAGIKPHTVAADTTQSTSHFVGEDFERVTISPAFIAHLDEAVVYTQGRAKFVTLDALLHDTVPVIEQPAQALKSAGKLTVFTDYKSNK